MSRSISWVLVVVMGCAEGTALTGGGGGEAAGAGPSSGGSGGEGNAGPGGSGGEGASTFTGGGGSGGGVDKCGNGLIDAGEDCDGADLGGADCASIGQGFVDGTLSCDVDCAFDTGGCNAPLDCGNGTIDAGEDCDGTNLGGNTCLSNGFASGLVSCTGGCVLDTSACYSCGNGTIEGPEACDGSALMGQTCSSLGHDGGTLSCLTTCLALNENACTDCGDGAIETGEQCDGANLGGQTCVSQGFAGGSLSCSAACVFNFASCFGQTCGNGVIEGTETCDGAALGGQTCVTQGFVSGALGCNGSCTGYVTTGCTGAACSDALDNDTDGFTDLGDPGCTSPSDNDEFIYAQNCNGVGGIIYDISQTPVSDFVITGTTVGSPAALSPTDFSDDCSSLSSSEVVMLYRNAAPQNGVIFSLDNPGTNFDSVLYIRQASCSQGAIELCNDDGFFTLASELFVNLPAGDFFIIVDGYNGQVGNFELSVDFP